MKGTLGWEITPEERRGQVRSFILRTWFLFVALLLITPFLYPSTFLEIKLGLINPRQLLSTTAYSVAGTLVAIGVLFLSNKFFRYPSRSYMLDSSGVKISIDEKEGRFSWDDFEYFYSYSSRTHATKPDHFYGRPCRLSQEAADQLGQLEQSAQEIEGGIFYLKKKTRGFFKFYKVFVVVHAKPTNTDSVTDFLNQYLPEKSMISSSDLGLVFYEFK